MLPILVTHAQMVTKVGGQICQLWFCKRLVNRNNWTPYVTLNVNQGGGWHSWNDVRKNAGVSTVVFYGTIKKQKKKNHGLRFIYSHTSQGYSAWIFPGALCHWKSMELPEISRVTYSSVLTYNKYRQLSNVRRTSVGNKIVDHSDVVGASPVGAAPTTSSFST